LRYEEAPQPEPAQGEALVRVHAAGVNPIDWKIRKGDIMKEQLAGRLPLILGWDLSGTVERLGTGVTGFSIGDAVYTRPDFTRDGAYAEYIVVRAADLARKPRSLDHVHAAAVPLAGLTAWQALFEPNAIGLTKGQRVLIQGAAGGVGTYAVQFARWKRAHVIATASAKNASFLKELGADEVVDYTRQRFEEVVKGVDAVLDTIGGETQSRSWATLKPGGVLASIVGPPSAELAKAHRARGVGVFVKTVTADLDEISTLIDAKAVRPIVSEVLPLAEARRAHELSEAGHVRGKIVLRVV
jgi:NADPH:quinone reductase-like Zn-dependent oxidoreductase